MDDEKKKPAAENQDAGSESGDEAAQQQSVSETKSAESSDKKSSKAPEATAKKPAESDSEEKPAVEKKDKAAKADDSESKETAQAGEKKAAADKPAAKQPAAKKPAAKKPVKRRPRTRGPAYEDLEEDELLAALRARFGEANASGQKFLEQSIYTVDLDVLYDVMLFLRDEPDWQFDYLVDLTALDYLEEEKRFCLLYHLHSHPHNSLIRVKCRLGVDVFAPSVTSIWTTADWLEREVYDMFGIEFSGHPDLRRILLPEDWHGYPLRKDYDIKLQDQSWIRKHLKIRKVPS